MSALRHLSGLARRPGLPRRTVRLRLTALYGALFLVCGAALLTITNLLARSWPWPKPAALKFPVGSRVGRLCTVTPHPSCYTPAQLQAQAAAAHSAALNQLLAESAIALAIMVVVAAALGWLVAGRVLRPLETGFAAQRRFAANASHELRTPLAMMRTSLDVAIAKPGPVPPELTVLAGKLREGLDQADHLVENLLLLARAQHGAIDDQDTFPLGPLVADAIGARAGLIGSLGLDVRLTVPDGPGPLVTGNPVLLAQMIANLVDNAVRHNHPGGWFRIQITRDGPVVRLLVENGGPFLDPGTVTTLTQPFRRLGTDRTGSATGTGLGLSIADAIATAHGGTLRLHARQGGGLQAIIDLPAASTGSPAQLALTGGVR